MLRKNSCNSLEVSDSESDDETEFSEDKKVSLYLEKISEESKISNSDEYVDYSYKQSRIDLLNKLPKKIHRHTVNLKHVLQKRRSQEKARGNRSGKKKN